MKFVSQVIVAAVLLAMPLSSCRCDLVTAPPASATLTGVSPERGFNGEAVTITISGTGLEPRVTQDLGAPDGVKVDTAFTATLGETSLEQLTWVDSETLTAVVPAGIAAGTYALAVVTPFGETLTLAAAYTATAQATPSLIRAEPADVVNDADTQVTLTGTNLAAGVEVALVAADNTETALTVSDASGASVLVTVPGAAATGDYSLVARIDGLEARLTDALTVHAPAALTTTIAATPSLVSLDADFTVTITVANDGATTAEGVVPDAPTLSGSGGATLVSGPTPSSADVAAGASADFVYTYNGDGSGEVTLAARARGLNEFSGREVVSAEATSTPVVVEVPATLTATWVVPAAVSVGQTFIVDLQVRNDGQSAANGVAPTLDTPAGTGALTLVGAVDPLVTDIASGATATFSFTYTATTPGDVTLSGRATGTDGVSGDPLTSGLVNATAIAVQTPAALAAVWDVQAFATVDQALELRLDVSNTGLAAAIDVTPDAPTVTTTGNATASLTTSPAAQTIPGGTTTTFTWTFAIGAETGTLAFSTRVEGADANAQTAVRSPTATSDPVTVQLPAVLTATLAVPATLSAGQTADVVMVVENIGQATAANVQPNQLAVDAGGTGATATPGTPSAAQNLAAGETVTFTYSYTIGAGLGTLVFSGTAAGTDANTGLPVATPIATTNLATVEAGATLDAAFQVPPFVSVGQTFNVIVTVQNDGGADALTTAPQSAPSPQPGNRASFVSGPVPVNATVAGAGGTAQFAYQYTADAEGTVSFSVNVVGVDENSGQNVASGQVTSADITVQPAPDLAATITAPSAVTEGQTFDVTMEVTNNGVSILEGTLPVLPLTQTPAGAATLVSAPATPVDVAAGGGQTTFTWTFTAGAAQTFVFEGAASGTDAMTNQPVTSPTVQSGFVEIQTPPALSFAWATPTTVSYDQAFTATLTITNDGGATANAVTPAAAVLGGGTGTVCLAADPVSATLAGAASANFTYACTAGTTSGDATLAVDVAAVDANSLADLAFGPTTSDAVAVQSPPSLALTWTVDLPGTGDVSYGQVFAAHLDVDNNGEASATVSPDALVVNGATGTACNAAVPASVTVAGAGTETFDYTCTAGGTSGAFSLDGAVSGTDDNDAAAVSAGPENSGDVDNESPASFSVAFEALPARQAYGAFTVSATITNDGEASATGAAPAAFAVGGASGTTCGAPNPTSADLAGGASQTFDYSCTAAAPSEVEDFTVDAVGTDENSGVVTAAPNAPVTSDTVIIGAPAVLAVDTVTAVDATVYRNQQALVVSFTVRNDGEAPADVSAVTLSFDNGGDVTAEYTVTADVGNATEVLAGAPATFTFAVDVDAAATLGSTTIEGAVTAVDRWDGLVDASDAGADVTDSWTVAINTPPVACFTLTDLRTARLGGDPFAVDGSCSTDAEGHALTYDWDWENDATYDDLDTGATASHAYAVPVATTMYEMTVRVTDEIGDSHTFSYWVAVAAAGDLRVVDDAGGGTGAGTLRGEVGNANAGDVIVFDESVFDGTPTTIAVFNDVNLNDTGLTLMGHAGVIVDFRNNNDRLRFQQDNITVGYLQLQNSSTHCVETDAGDTDGWLFGSVITDCGGSGIELNSAGHHIGPGNVIADNINAHGIVMASADNGHWIEGNTIGNVGQDGVSSGSGTDGNVIERNVIYGVGDDGISFTNGGTDALQIFHNTIDASGGFAMRLDGGGTPHNVRNNLMTDNVDGGICDESSNLVANNNGFNGNGAVACSDDGTDAATDINADPLYEDQGNADYRLTATSPAIDQGDPTVATDVNGAGVGTFNNAAPDLGALETNASP